MLIKKEKLLIIAGAGASIPFGNYSCADIDNMFKERLEVKEKCNIPVFDADGFEFLLDWRI